MGEKGAKLTQEAEAAAQSAERRLAVLGEISGRKMFGGFGLFENGKMFAIVNSRAELFFKVSDESRERFSSAGSHQHGKMPYYSVPSEILADDARFLEWAGEAIAVAYG